MCFMIWMRRILIRFSYSSGLVFLVGGLVVLGIIERYGMKRYVNGKYSNDSFYERRVFSW